MRRQIDPWELDTLYLGIGRCVWHLQYVEDVLHTFIAMKVEIKQPGAVTEAEAKELLAKHRRTTLGNALRTAEKNRVLSADLIARLTHLKEERDWLVHRSLNQNGDDLYTSEGRSAVLQRLESFIAEATSLHRALMSELASFVESHGLSTAKADALERQKIARLKGDTFPSSGSTNS